MSSMLQPPTHQNLTPLMVSFQLPHDNNANDGEKSTGKSNGNIVSNRCRNRSREPGSLDARVEREGITEFFGSQVGGESVISYSYTDMPFRLLLWDISTFFFYAWALPWILWPLRPTDGGHFDELSLTRGNIWCVFVHAVLVVLQLGFILVLPLGLLFPVWMVLVVLVAFATVNWLLCRLLNGDSLTYQSDPKYAPELSEHAHEKWIFLNGVAVGEAWMLSNINRLALTFKRPVLGIHNRTSGIIFDVVECLIQRNFSYATGDVRRAYKEVKGYLYKPGISKVVFILHSQGGIEGGLVLDWLLQELPQDLLSKLEVYTFGNAANHFNSPHRHRVSQSAEVMHLPDPRQMATSTMVTQMPIVESPTEVRTPFPQSKSTQESGDNGSIDQHGPPNRRKSSMARTTSSLVLPAADRALGYVEHYAHTTDFVALWGVLHFATNKRASLSLPRFIGRVFSRTSTRGGHQFCQHYLNGMFPLQRDSVTGEFLGCKDSNEFMDSIVEHAKVGAERENLREEWGNSWNMLQRAGRLDSSHEVAVHGSFHDKRPQSSKMRVKDLSRLWLYRNGKSPPELPRGLSPDHDAGLRRMGTI